MDASFEEAGTRGLGWKEHCITSHHVPLLPCYSHSYTVDSFETREIRCIAYMRVLAVL